MSEVVGVEVDRVWISCLKNFLGFIWICSFQPSQLTLLSFPENAALFDISIKKENEFWYPPCIMIRQVEGQQHCRTSVASVFIRL